MATKVNSTPQEVPRNEQASEANQRKKNNPPVPHPARYTLGQVITILAQSSEGQKFYVQAYVVGVIFSQTKNTWIYRVHVPPLSMKNDNEDFEDKGTFLRVEENAIITFPLSSMVKGDSQDTVKVSNNIVEL